jgi:16S rRNA (guanine527-N7)-methyltransferase
MIIPSPSERLAVQTLFPEVSHETWECLDILVDMIISWQAKINLISSHTLEGIWSRHIADSIQLIRCVNDAMIWVDVGSGGGFPALVIAAAYIKRDNFIIHMIESDHRKCIFLREAARVMKVHAQVHVGRIENVLQKFDVRADVVTARALAPLPKLLDLTQPLMNKGAIGLFLKGKSASQELTDALKCWNINYHLTPSLTNPEAQILVIKDISMLGKPTTGCQYE